MADFQKLRAECKSAGQAAKAANEKYHDLKAQVAAAQVDYECDAQIALIEARRKQVKGERGE